MADLKISQLTDGNPAQTNDQIPINRAGVNFKITAGSIASLATGNAADTEVLFNDGGVVEGNANLTFNKTSNTLSVTAASTTSYQLASSGIITEAGTTRTLSATDNGKIIYCTSNSAVTITTATGLGAGFSCVVVQGGTAQVTVNQGSSTTRVSYGSLFKTAGQYAVMSIVCPVADTFVIAGQTA
jgi:hypothetical protein